MGQDHTTAATSPFRREPDPWRAELLDQVLRVVFWLGVVVAVPGMAFAAITGETAIIVIDLIAIAIVGTVTFVRRFGFLCRAVVLLSVSFGLGVFFLTTVGLVGQVYLLAFPVFATLLLGMRAAIWALFINAVTLMVLGIAGFADPALAIPGLDGWQSWLVVNLNFMFVNAVMAIFCGILLRRLEQSLADANALSGSLADRNDELERSEEIRLAFLRATSHELRTPLSAIIGFAETLQRRGGQLAPDQQRGLVERLSVNAHRLGVLIGDLLDVDRLSSGLVTANRRRHDVAVLVGNVIEEVDPLGERTVADLRSIDVDVDAPKIERAIVNIVANALRHTAPGHPVEVTTLQADGQVIVRVDDHGNGIATGYFEAIFDPFVQGPERRSDPQPGTGKGLTLAREMVRLHGGEISATNREGGGARFEIVLPAPDRAV